MPATKKGKKTEFRYQVRYVFRGQTRYGIVSHDKAKTAGNVIIDDAVLPFRAEVKDDANVVDIPHSFTSKDGFPEYDRDTGLLIKGGNEFDKFVSQEHAAALAISEKAGKGVTVGKLFSIGVADGHAVYVITKIAGTRVTVEWRGFGGGDRYTDHFFGFGPKTVSKKDVERYIKGEEGWADFCKKSEDRDRAIIESQPVGAILHYVDGYFLGNRVDGKEYKPWSKFIRYKVVELHGGRKAAQFVGICGDWPEHSLPHRTAWGSEYMDHDIEYKLKNPILEKLHAPKVYESATGDTADLKRSEIPNPATLPLIDLTMPAATPEQVRCGHVNDVLQAVRDAANGKDNERADFNSAEAMRRLVNAYKAIREELKGWTREEIVSHGIKDGLLCEDD